MFAMFVAHRRVGKVVPDLLLETTFAGHREWLVSEGEALARNVRSINGLI